MSDFLTIAGKFDLNGEAYSCKPYGSGHIHDTYLLESKDEEVHRYILQRLNTFVFTKPDAVQDNIWRILSFLKKQEEVKKPVGIRDLGLIETKDGELAFIDANGSYWRCFDFIDDTFVLDNVQNPSQAFEGARLFGDFLARLMDYDPRRLHVTIPRFMDAEWRQEQLTMAEFTNPGDRLKQAQPELKRIRQLQKISDQYIRLQQALPDRVVHNDTKINNVLFDQATGKGITVIDLDTVMTGKMLTDFGDMVRTFTVKGSEDSTDRASYTCQAALFEGLVSGYAEVLSPVITEVELANLLLGGKIVIYMQAIRFLADYINGDVYYKVTSPEQNLLRTRNQLNLLDSVLEQESDLQRIIASSFQSGN
jgi:hypothetical protein